MVYLWFAACTTEGVISKLTAAGTMTPYPVSSQFCPQWVAAGSDGAIFGSLSSIRAQGRRSPGTRSNRYKRERLGIRAACE